MPDYDIIIVGAGLSGALLAAKLTAMKPSPKVLLLEAGPGNVNRQYHLNTFYAASNKFPEAPYPPGRGAPSADLADLIAYGNNTPEKGYLVYTPGSLTYRSTFERLVGGTVWHWLGTSLRLNPNDMQLYSKYLKQSGLGSPAIDWPIGYSDAEPWYEAAEEAIGVSANVQDQTYPQGAPFRAGYQYPMPPITPSYLDQVLAGVLNGFEVPGYNPPIPITVRSTPQARNSMNYNGRPPCMGNTNCVPICPIAAKYDPLVHVNLAVGQGAILQSQSVACEILVGSDGKTITGINYKTYDGVVQPTITAKLYVLAMHAIETPKLLLLSNREKGGVANSSDQVGRNLMDHNTQLSWAEMPADKPVYPYRGPLATCGIEDMRDGPFRAQRGAFRMEIGNDGWNWPTGAPADNVMQAVVHGAWGGSLRQAIHDQCSRQLRIACLVEPIADGNNRVQISTYDDAIGIPRPLITYNLQEYESNGLQAAYDASKSVYGKLGASDQTAPGSAAPDGFYGAGHILGTARMGSDAKSSVTDSYGHTWDHPNLFIVGAPLFPSVGTSNPSLTIAALTLRTADYISNNWSTLSAS